MRLVAWVWSLRCSYRYGAAAERHVLGKGSGGTFFDPHGSTTSRLINRRGLLQEDERRVKHRTKLWLPPRFTVVARLGKAGGFVRQSTRPHVRSAGYVVW